MLVLVICDFENYSLEITKKCSDLGWKTIWQGGLGVPLLPVTVCGWEKVVLNDFIVPSQFKFSGFVLAIALFQGGD